MKKMIGYSWFNSETAYKNGWELNLRIGSCQLRIAKHQLAFWVGYDALFDFQF